MEAGQPDNPKRKLSHHLSFGNFFFIKNDLTVFQLTGKDFEKREVLIQVFNHPELRTTISFDEIVYPLRREEIAVIALLVTKYNS